MPVPVTMLQYRVIPPIVPIEKLPFVTRFAGPLESIVCMASPLGVASIVPWVASALELPSLDVFGASAFVVASDEDVEASGREPLSKRQLRRRTYCSSR
jgi:hypothetical protein